MIMRVIIICVSVAVSSYSSYSAYVHAAYGYYSSAVYYYFLRLRCRRLLLLVCLILPTISMLRLYLMIVFFLLRVLFFCF